MQWMIPNWTLSVSGDAATWRDESINIARRTIVSCIVAFK
jgi:hypothetical protein